MSWKAVVFDFDGVLCDSRERAIQGVEQLRQDVRFSVLPSPARTGHFGELYRGPLNRALLHHGLSESESREFFDRHAQFMRENGGLSPLYPGVVEGLRGLADYRLAIISSAYSDVIRDALTQSGYSNQELPIIGHEVHATKTEKARGLFAEWHIDASEAVYVGDMESDVEYCRALGLRCIACTYGYHPRKLLRATGAWKLVDSPSELFGTLRKGAAA